jgi:FkbM family methyltransferase
LQRLVFWLKSELLDTKSSVAAIELLNESESQLRQDLFILIASGWKRNGYFVEFGATDGKHLSNTWILEKKYGWLGILAEPDPRFHKNLASNRASNIDFSCVYTRTGDTIKFLQAGQLGTILEYIDVDEHVRKGQVIPVPTITLEDLLTKYCAPNYIDYLSIDTEGSEYSILENFDFEKRQFGCITVEHNYTQNRDKIFSLLISKGYTRVFTELSSFDDWYIHNSLSSVLIRD